MTDEAEFVEGLCRALGEEVGERCWVELCNPYVVKVKEEWKKNYVHIYVIYGKTLVFRELKTGETHMLDLSLPESDPVSFCVERLRWVGFVGGEVGT